MPNRKLLTLFLVTCLIGCGDGIQRGRFSTTRSHSVSVGPTASYLTIISGYPLTADGQSIGDQQNLLYLLVICPGTSSRDGGVSDDWGSYVTTVKYQWGRVSVAIPWDRRTDTVSVGGQTFDRAKGNVFVVRRKIDGKVVAQQLSGLGPHVFSEGALRHIREQLPADALVASLNELKNE